MQNKRVICVLSLAVAGLVQGQAPSKKTFPAKPAVGEPKFKAIWEPANVKEDLELFSVHFVSPDEGWVAGGKSVMAGGVILHTQDGGMTWQTQLGDPQSSDRAYRDMRFLGPKLGWAVQSTGIGDHKLLRTTDGQNWSVAGTVGQHRSDYQFTSAEVGFYTHGSSIARTLDGGRSWQPAYQCLVKTEVGGLTRDLACQFGALSFVNPELGYVISGALSDGAGFVLAKTEDGGTTWKTSIILPGEDGKEGALHFFDEKTGVLRTLNGKLFRTEDGGQSWKESPGQPGGKPDIEFAGAEIGWMMRYRSMTYTTNGGKTWISREIGFPSTVNAFCLTRRDRGYAVGDHGMVYRYRVVPINYTVSGMIPAPAMPAR